MTIEYFFRQLKASGFECIVDNSLHMQRLRLTGWQYQRKNVSLCGGMASGFPSGNTHIDFEMIDGSFYNGPYFISTIPFIRITLDSKKHS